MDPANINLGHLPNFRSATMSKFVNFQNKYSIMDTPFQQKLSFPALTFYHDFFRSIIGQSSFDWRKFRPAHHRIEVDQTKTGRMLANFSMYICFRQVSPVSFSVPVPES